METLSKSDVSVNKQKNWHIAKNEVPTPILFISLG